MIISGIYFRFWLFYIFQSVSRARGKFFKFGPCVFQWGDQCPVPEIKYHLYTRYNPSKPQIMVNGMKENAIIRSNWDPNKPNKIIIHGYNSDATLSQLIYIKDEYLRQNSYNVWMIDWSPVALGPCYPVVVSNLDYVAKCAFPLLASLLKLSNLPPSSSIHVIGFSVGAHLAAFIANYLRPFKLPDSDYKAAIYNVFAGLDPALPLFTTIIKDRKLDKSDARFVDVVHTDAFTQGKIERSGHVDFYMNGGVYQTGCWSENVAEISSCNHHRAPEYFAESITSDVGFWGTPCQGFICYMTGCCNYNNPTTIMGEYVDKSARGYFIVPTWDKKPYAKGKKTDASIRIRVYYTPMDLLTNNNI